jgi:hypothetical protein
MFFPTMPEPPVNRTFTVGCGLGLLRPAGVRVQPPADVLHRGEHYTIGRAFQGPVRRAFIL